MKKLRNFKQHLIQFTGLTDIVFSKGLRKNVDITIAHVVKLPMLAGLRPILYEPRGWKHEFPNLIGGNGN